MFNIGGTELILILLIAFVIVGPKDLPKIARFLARAVKWVRSLVNEVKSETGLDELDGTFKELQQDVKGIKNDMNEVGRSLNKDVKDASRSIDEEIKDARREADVSQELRASKREIDQELKIKEKSL